MFNRLDRLIFEFLGCAMNVALVWCVASAAAPRAPSPENLVVNPSFIHPGAGPRSPAKGWIGNEVCLAVCE